MAPRHAMIHHEQQGSNIYQPILGRVLPTTRLYIAYEFHLPPVD